MGWLCVMGSVIRPQQLPKVERTILFLITTAPPPRTPHAPFVSSFVACRRRPPPTIRRLISLRNSPPNLFACRRRHRSRVAHVVIPSLGGEHLPISAQQ